MGYKHIKKNRLKQIKLYINLDYKIIKYLSKILIITIEYCDYIYNECYCCICLCYIFLLHYDSFRLGIKQLKYFNYIFLKIIDEILTIFINEIVIIFNKLFSRYI